MRQVPYYLIIGSGRMASHFRHYLTLLHLPFKTWSRRHNTKEELSLSSQTCSHVLLLINDNAIEDFVHQHPCLKDKNIIHFSGQLSLENIYGAHPLMTFSRFLYDLETYKNIVFILEEDAPDLNQLLPGLSNAYFKIPRELKPYYHALCVISGNFTCLLWGKFFKEIESRFSIPKSIAFPYLQQITKNLIENSDEALTGPLARGDQTTIEANLKALANDEFKLIYQSFVKTFQAMEEKNERP